jgi:aspartyl-tRNA(Asn)/glutamyl-tRNA(Gln) amidotransferase subunit B
VTAADDHPATDWETVIGLEVHCELRTATKLFCGCRNRFGDEPNTNVCPVCLGLPGSLPVINEQAVELAMRVGLALHCEVRPSIFHRKNYFYPDMPKDYQVSQYDEPINVDGRLDLPDGTRVGIERAHMEEDTGKSTHVGGTGRIADATHSLVDYNRAGVPLVEIVSRPDLRSAADAKAYVSELRAILVAIGASDGRMEEGSLRVDANVSIRPRGTDGYGTRCEIKNLNSLRSVARAIDYEVARQAAEREAGNRIVQETRHWNEGEGRTSSLRSKEEAYDYRYFPEPDLVPLAPSDAWVEAVRHALPTLPAERRVGLAAAVGADPASEMVVTAVDRGVDRLVLDAVAAGADGRIALSRAVNDLAVDAFVDVDQFVRLVGLEADGRLTPTQSKRVLEEMVARSGGDPAVLAADLGLEAMAGDRLAAVVDELIAAHPRDFADFVGGNDKVAGKFVGLAMKATGGKANGRIVSQLLRDRREAAGR